MLTRKKNDKIVQKNSGSIYILYTCLSTEREILPVSPWSPIGSWTPKKEKRMAQDCSCSLHKINFLQNICLCTFCDNGSPIPHTYFVLYTICLKSWSIILTKIIQLIVHIQQIIELFVTHERCILSIVIKFVSD